MVEDGLADSHRVVFEVFIEGPGLLLEFLCVAPTGERALVGVFYAVLKDGGEDLIRLGPRGIVAVFIELVLPVVSIPAVANVLTLRHGSNHEDPELRPRRLP